MLTEQGARARAVARPISDRWARCFSQELVGVSSQRLRSTGHPVHAIVLFTRLLDNARADSTSIEVAHTAHRLPVPDLDGQRHRTRRRAGVIPNSDECTVADRLKVCRPARKRYWAAVRWRRVSMRHRVARLRHGIAACAFPAVRLMCAGRDAANWSPYCADLPARVKSQ